MWALSEIPIGVVVPDTAETRDGQLAQRKAISGAVLAGGGVVLLLADRSGLTRVIVADADLQRIMDADDPDGIHHNRIPTMSPGWGHSWIEGGKAYLSGRRASLGDFVLELERGVGRRGPLEILQMDPDGRFTGPPMLIPGIEGVWHGVFSDGSLLLAGSFQNVPGVDSVIASPLRIVRAPTESAAPGGRVSQPVLFTTGVLRDRRRRRWPSPLPFAHNAGRTVAVTDDTIWVVPSERPELLALDRSGEVLLRIEWDAGDRTVPAGLPDWAGLERFPAASALVAGSDGRIYVQRWSVQRGYPVPGPEWLVFSPSGDLLGRVDIPRSLRVLAFGPNSALVQGTNDSGVDEVRLHALEAR